jgi:hypothetical protein
MLEIPGNSKNSYNLVGFFENQKLGARLAYNYRSAFFITFDRSTRLNQAALKSLDASLAYNIFHGITLTADGVNLTNEKIIQFDTDRTRPRDLRQRTLLLRRPPVPAVITKAEGRRQRQKAESRRQKDFQFCLLASAFCRVPPCLRKKTGKHFCLLPSAFCLLPSAFCLLPSAFCLLPSAFCLQGIQKSRG